MIMTTTKKLPTTPFTKNPAWNIFHVYDEMPRAKQATKELKSLCDKFLSEHERIAKKYTDEGAADTDVRESILKYIQTRIY
jgi:hypothetical protein